MAHCKRSQGFTLVELLVVIGIIGLLLALFLPAIHSTRRTESRRNTCANNMRQISTAMASFEQAHMHFPGSLNKIIPPGMDRQVITTYLVPLLPLMECSDLYAEWANPRASDRIRAEYAPFMDILLCPSARKGGATTAALPPYPELTYVVNGGNGDGSAGAPSAALDQPANGVCHNLVQTSATVGLSFIRSNDGIAHTLLVSENLSAGPWVLDQSVLPHDADPATLDRLARAARLQTTFLWFDLPSAQDLTIVRINGKRENAPQPLSVEQYDNHRRFARPSSNHPGGVNAVFADNHVQFLDEGIDYDVYKQLMTPQSIRSHDSVKKMISDADY